MKIIDVNLIEKKYKKLLEKAGYLNIEDLLKLETASQIKKLAKKTGIPAKLIDTWQEIADLLRIKEIEIGDADVINKIGIDSVKEFAQRNAKNTLDKIKNFIKDSSKVPSLEEIKNWIEQATLLKLGRDPTAIAPFNNQTDDKYGSYGADYWNSKWEKAPIIYIGRALRGESYTKQIDVDVKAFIFKNDEILKHVIKQANLKKSSFNETALACQRFVCDFLLYMYDEEQASAEVPEFWQFPFETIFL